MKSYLDMVQHVLQHGEEHSDRTGVGTLSVFGYQWRHDMRDGFPLITVKRTSLRWIAEELIWFISGSSDEGGLRDKGVDIWKEWATPEMCAKFDRVEGDLGPIYGPMLRTFPVGYSPHDPLVPPRICDKTTDQLGSLIEDLRKNPNSRRHVVSYWHSFYSRRVELPPCHTLWQVKCHADGKGLSLHLYCRSIDSFLGFPYDVASYGLLLHLLATAINREPRDLIISFGDLHLYKSHLAQAHVMLNRKPKTLPVIRIDERLQDCGLETLTEFKWDDVHFLREYVAHAPLKAEVAV